MFILMIPMGTSMIPMVTQVVAAALAVALASNEAKNEASVLLYPNFMGKKELGSPFSIPFFSHTLCL
jgi:hypothetical protein